VHEFEPVDIADMAMDYFRFMVREVGYVESHVDLAIRKAIADTVASQRLDDPDLDGTDGAHPAWWRGSDHACDMAATRLYGAIIGTDDGNGVLAHPGLERIRRWILEHR
jgi:hypothetical protein